MFIVVYCLFVVCFPHLFHIVWAEASSDELVLMEDLGIRALCHLHHGVDETEHGRLQTNKQTNVTDYEMKMMV